MRRQISRQLLVIPVFHVIPGTQAIPATFSPWKLSQLRGKTDRPGKEHESMEPDLNVKS